MTRPLSQQYPPQVRFLWLDHIISRLIVVLLSLLDSQTHALEELQIACGDGAELNEMTLAGFSDTLGSATHLNLITLHSAKSLEFAAVIMMGLEQGRLPGYGLNTVEAKREPRRLFYVGLT